LLSSTTAASLPSAAAISLKDDRVRAIVAMAPVGVPLTAESLAAVRPATMIYEAELDRFLARTYYVARSSNESNVRFFECAHSVIPTSPLKPSQDCSSVPARPS
jgi:hypothetical protein